MTEPNIKYSIELLQKHEKTALKMNPDGYYLTLMIYGKVYMKRIE